MEEWRPIKGYEGLYEVNACKAFGVSKSNASLCIKKGWKIARKYHLEYA